MKMKLKIVTGTRRKKKKKEKKLRDPARQKKSPRTAGITCHSLLDHPLLLWFDDSTTSTQCMTSQSCRQGAELDYRLKPAYGPARNGIDSTQQRDVSTASVWMFPNQASRTRRCLPSLTKVAGAPHSTCWTRRGSISKNQGGISGNNLIQREAIAIIHRRVMGKRGVGGLDSDTLGCKANRRDLEQWELGSRLIIIRPRAIEQVEVRMAKRLGMHEMQKGDFELESFSLDGTGSSG